MSELGSATQFDENGVAVLYVIEERADDLSLVCLIEVLCCDVIFKRKETFIKSEGA